MGRRATGGPPPTSVIAPREPAAAPRHRRPRVARLTPSPSDDGHTGPRLYRARHQSFSEARRARRVARLAGRQPAHRAGRPRQARRGSSTRPRQQRRQEGDLVSVRCPRAAPWAADAPASTSGRLDEEREGGLHDRHPRPRHPARVSAARCRRGGSGQSRRPWSTARTGARCRWSPSTRPTPRTTTTRSTPSRTAIAAIPAATSSPSPSPTSPGMCAPGSAMDREALNRGQLGLFPRPRRAHAARAHLQRPVLAARGRGPAGARRAHDLLRRRPQAQPPLPSRHDALGRQALLRRRRRRPSTAAPRRPAAAARRRRSPHCGRPIESLKRGRDEREPLELDLPERKVLVAARRHRSTASSCPSGWKPTA